jgi:hypothetical protein
VTLAPDSRDGGHAEQTDMQTTRLALGTVTTHAESAQGGFSSPVTLRRRRQAHRLDEWHRDLIQDLGELLTGSL